MVATGMRCAHTSNMALKNAALLALIGTLLRFAESWRIVSGDQKVENFHLSTTRQHLYPDGIANQMEVERFQRTGSSSNILIPDRDRAGRKRTAGGRCVEKSPYVRTV